MHIERFGVPGKSLAGSDSHTPAAGALGMLAFGSGGLDVAFAMAGEPLYLKMPRVLGVELTGSLPPWVSAKDVVLEMLRRHDVKGCKGMILEYRGPGLEHLSAMDRHVIANMGTELGATTTVFPSDGETRLFLASQGRLEDWREILPDEGAEYDPTSRQLLENLTDMGSLQHLIHAGARIHQPGCNGCIGMGQAPATGRISLRTIPRNFPARSGTKEDQVYLCSPETAAASALTGEITAPPPPGNVYTLEKGPNIKALPEFGPLPDTFRLPVLIKLGDNVSTDEILRAGAEVLPFRSNIPEISKWTYYTRDESFHGRALEARESYGGHLAVAGDN